MTHASAEDILTALGGLLLERIPGNPVRNEIIRNVESGPDGVELELNMPSPEHPRLAEAEAAIRRAIAEVPGAGKVRIRSGWSVRTPEPGTAPPLPGVKTVLAVASGTGGVGKSTVSAYLAVALSRMGLRVGLLDADIHGPSAALALGDPGAPGIHEGQKLSPARIQGVDFLSMSHLIPEDQAVVWRGPMLHQMVLQFASAAWEDLDILVLDLPPGTGDVQLTVTQSLPVTGALVVTTPQEIALIDARRGLRMFQDAKIPVVGLVENMAHWECSCGKRHTVFGEGGGERLSQEADVPLLTGIPLDPAAYQSPSGPPEGGTPGAAVFHALAVQVATALGGLAMKRNPFRVLSA
ncbi:MAG: Mrp/NBP35 family ATP-binding protein [Gemmatimonadota bacterium]|nr:Mrp/NBP35 family ATP-binding protein [Gemmatimonadota bacterium]